MSYVSTFTSCPNGTLGGGGAGAPEDWKKLLLRATTQVCVKFQTDIETMSGVATARATV